MSLALAGVVHLWGESAWFGPVTGTATETRIAAMTGDAPLYTDRAPLYDKIYSWKDYGAEALRIAEILDAQGVELGAAVVEAACGTGAYLEQLADRYAVSGFDLQPSMLELAREKLPEVEFFVSDMRTVELDTPIDAILCAGRADLDFRRRWFRRALGRGRLDTRSWPPDRHSGSSTRLKLPQSHPPQRASETYYSRTHSSAAPRR